MKREFKKIGLVAILTLISFGGANAQEGTKKNVIGAGASVSGYGFGGNLSYQRMVSPKLAIGARLVAVTSKYSRTELAEPPTTFDSFTYKYTGSQTHISVGATYFFVGDATQSKFSMYSGLGLGYMMTRTTNNFRFPPSKVLYEEAVSVDGFAVVLTLGTSYKIGPGKLFLEFLLTQMITGKSKWNFDYPAGSLTDANGNTVVNNPPENYERKNGWGNLYIPLSLGYTISF
jgi:hypothetical protein